MDASALWNDELSLSEVAGANTQALTIGVGPEYSLGPERIYTEPQRVWLPVPQGVDRAKAQLYYYHGAGDAIGWYPAEAVEDWLVPDSQLYLDIEGATYIGFLVRHAGIVQLGVPRE